jgi:Flp pilus assembly protein TadD
MLNKINISHKEQILIVYLFLFAVTFAVYWQVTRYDAVSIDDLLYINDHIMSGVTVESIHWAFGTKNTGLWQPLVWISFMLDYQLYGFMAGGYHYTNVIFHVFSTLLLFWLINRMTKAVWRGAFVAALFALHPLHVESVAWISERKDVLSAFFWMLTLCLYVHYTEKPVIKRYLLVLFCFSCALMSKPMVVTLPLIMILIDYWPLGRFQSMKGGVLLWQLKEKGSFFILSAATTFITLYNPVKPKDACTDIIPFGLRISNAPVSFITYLKKIFWPRDLAILYPLPDTYPFWQVFGTLLLIIIIFTAVIVTARRMPYLFVGWFWYAITLLPVIGIIQAGNEAMADRYTYLPSIGIFIIFAWGIPAFYRSEKIRNRILFPAGISAIAVFSVLTWQQCSYWKNDTELLGHALQVKKDNYLALNYSGLSMLLDGKAQEAINQFNKAIRVKPDFAEAYKNRGNAYYKLEQYQRSIEDYNETIRMKPDFDEAYINRGNAHLMLEQYQLALDDYDKAIRPKSNYARVYKDRGITHYWLGNYSLAMDDFTEAIALEPGYAEAFSMRGIVYLFQHNEELGCSDLQKACTLGKCKLLESARVKGHCL